MRAWMMKLVEVGLVTLGVVFGSLLLGCAANQKQAVTPVQETASQTGQTQPSEVRIHDIKQWYFAGAGQPMVVEQTKPGQMNQPTATSQPTADLLRAKAQFADPNDFGTVTSEAPGDGRYVINVTNVYRAWNDASAGSETAQTASQAATVTAELEQTVRVVFSAMLELAQGLLTQQGGTVGQAAEGSTGEATGGAQDADLNIRLERLISVLENAVFDPNKPATQPAVP